ncbi:carbon monoxide dehydrogenase [Sulfodiicoccus acidiphilus]|uniref:Carbon monoxide dehydrogenase n=1 Tax=Sulfodiicoccus acidiphilus TaxID=1670455 RepID=A0A348B3N1_9CREN|nr:xanthine dehydrogenase family protein molybdopterin-binding subunit [Sulfodiicoccus acidiphilus]BBD72783.1 carbon monoxide dehydrogenase [Sulfodiicoccus acidiphilus]GGT99769.1 carbon monoxide dehydrogenase [Sulfodiicoccus acidiphilus]
MYVGKAIRRIEDPRLITGRGSYVDDIQLPGTLFVAFLRSQYAHAKVKVSAPKSSMGVFTGQQLNPGQDFPVASTEVTYVGQPVAAIISKDRYEAYDALESIDVEYERLSHVLNPRDALKNEVKVYSKAESNVKFDYTWKSGDVEAAMKGAEVVLEGTLENQRVVASPLETRGALAFFDGSRLNFWSSTQSAHYLRRNLTKFLGIDVHVVQPDVGGAFGSKIITHPEEFALGKIALIIRRPVKWIPTRSEEMQTAGHGRDKTLEFKAGFKRDGTLVALHGTLIGDLGAPYEEANGDELGNIKSSSRMLSGPYKVKDAQVRAFGVNTNKTPTTSYRGAGRPEATYFIERIMNMASIELKIDPIELRERNVVSELPYKNPFGITYDSGNYSEVLKRARKYYDSLSLEARAMGGCVGVAMYVEISGFGPWETARVFVKSDGKVQVFTGAGPHGQGDGTAFAQIAADELGIPLERIEVRWGDTDLIMDGIGTWGSRTVTVGGSAVKGACSELKRRLVEVGAKLLQSDVEEVEFVEGKVRNRKDGREVDFDEIAAKAYELGYSLDVSYSYPVRQITSPYGVHLALLNVDKETGEVRVLKYVALDDVGTVINPLLAEGQIHGGVVQGIAQALTEGLTLNEDGQVTNTSLSDYGLPKSNVTPRIEWVSLDLAKSAALTGSKGIGEAGAIAGTPTIMNGIEVCIGRKLIRMPVTGGKILGDLK